MSNATEYRDGMLTVHIDYLLDAMSDADKLDLAQRLSCEDAVIQHVAEQITEGCTEDGSRGSRLCSAEAEPQLPLDKAARQIAKASGDIARKEVEALEKEVARLNKENWKLRDEMSVIKTGRDFF